MIASGKKNYELRRRPPPIDAIGRIALIYSTAPECRVTLACNILEIITLPKSDLWDKIGEETGCLESEYFDYFRGLEFSSAIRLRPVKKNLPILTREVLMNEYDFTPPQSWRWAASLKTVIGEL